MKTFANSSWRDLSLVPVPGPTKASSGKIKTKKILILSGIHICHNPRVVKEADSLAEVGYDVTVLGMASLARLRVEDHELAQGKKWKFIEVAGPVSAGTGVRRICYGLIKKSADFFARTTGRQTEAQLGGWRYDLYREALRHPADLTIAHSAPTLWVALKLHRKGRAIAADFEDWFSRTHEKSFGYPDRIIEMLEREMFQKGRYVTCPSEAMARAMETVFSRTPSVIYNSFPLPPAQGLAVEPGGEGPKAIWISQALGPGRGLELLAEALSQCEPNFSLSLVGNPQGHYREELKRRIPESWKKRISFLDQVRDREVIHLISSHHLGLALELPHPDNKQLTISNKILQYLGCGLAVIATKTAGQMEVAQKTGDGVFLCDHEKANELAHRIKELMGNRQALRHAMTESRQAAKTHFHWSIEAQKLLRLVQLATQ